MTNDLAVSEATFAALRKDLDNERIVDLVITISLLQRGGAPARQLGRSMSSPSTSPISTSSRCPAAGRKCLMGDAGKKAAATPRPAATVVILRDGREGIEVFMVVRHHEIDFASGALVFPGGKVDEADADPAWAELAPSSASAPERAFLVASARETFEEAGLMLARRGGGADMVGADDAHRLVETYRARLRRGRDDLPRPRPQRGPAARRRPDGAVRALDHAGERSPSASTRTFCLVSAPVEQLGAHDGAESVEGFWIAPQQALRDAEAGTRTLLFPTHMNLLKLARYATVAEAVAVTRTSAHRHRHAASRAHGDGPHAAHPRRGRLRRHRVRRADARAEAVGAHASSAVSAEHSPAGAMFMTVARSERHRPRASEHDHGTQRCPVPSAAAGCRKGSSSIGFDNAARQISTWVEGSPEKSFWTGLSLKGRKMIEVQTYRCHRCGFLESYAK